MTTEWWLDDSAAGVVAPATRDEVDALREMYRSTGGRDWAASDGFRPPPPGLAASPEYRPSHGVRWLRGRVVCVDLHENGLTGPVPRASLKALGACARLCLFGNSLAGRLDPSSLPATLIHLDLSRNALDGPLDSTVGSLSRLKRLHVERNRFSGPLPPELGRLARLEVLTAHHNAFDGHLPDTLANCVALQTLWLHDNAELSGRVPEGLPPTLVSLLLTETKIVGPIPDDLSRRGTTCDVQLGPYGLIQAASGGDDDDDDDDDDVDYEATDGVLGEQSD